MKRCIALFSFLLTVCVDSYTENTIYYTQAASQSLARATCQQTGGELVSIHSEEDNTVVASKCPKSECWIGVQLVDGDPEWTDNSKFDFDNISPSPFTSQIFTLRVFDGQWNTRLPDDEFPAVCHYPIYLPGLVPDTETEVVVKRLFRIHKGAYDEVIDISKNGIWPFFETLGARIIGMWKVIYPPGQEPDYDDVYLVTRYANTEHWQWTRLAISCGQICGFSNESGRLQMSLSVQARAALTYESSAEYLVGEYHDSEPRFFPKVWVQDEL